MDSEGTNQKYNLCIRMCSYLQPVVDICNQLKIQPGRNHKGIRLQKWHPKSRAGINLYGFSISIKEWTRVGLGTYIKRKAKNGIVYKQ